MFTHTRLLMAAFSFVVATGSAWAQPIGTFKWQLQPYCNVISVAVTGVGGSFTLDGTDDLCGAVQKASVVGVASQNLDGTIGFGLTIVTPPEGAAVHVKATIDLASFNGTWSDSNGNTGSFVFTPGAGVPGPVRSTTVPTPTRVSHTFDLAPGAVSPPITIPNNIPVQLMGVTNTSGVRGVGQASLLSIPGSFIEWVGLHSTSGAAITEGFSGAAGTIILFIDFAHQVRVEVASSTQIQIRNAGAGQRTGVITITY